MVTKFMMNKSLKFSEKKEVFSINDAESIRYLYVEKNETFSLAVQKLQFKLDDKTKFKKKKGMLLEENTEEYIHDFEVGKQFLNRI